MDDIYQRCFIVEEKERSCCPECGGELAYEASYDNRDLVMYCKTCYYAGVVKDVYVDVDEEVY